MRIEPQQQEHLFYSLRWMDPIDGRPLTPRVLLHDPGGRPLFGALVTEDNLRGYPIISGIVMATPELAAQEKEWLEYMGLNTPCGRDENSFQQTASVESFGCEWTWDSEARTETDLIWRVASRYGLSRDFYADKLILDAGAGAGDQSRWLLASKARGVVSVDLSKSIEVVYRKLGHLKNG